MCLAFCGLLNDMYVGHGNPVMDNRFDENVVCVLWNLAFCNVVQMLCMLMMEIRLWTED